MGKGEIARNEQFLLFPQCFLSVWMTFSHFYHIRNCRLQTLSVWRSLKFVIWNGLMAFLEIACLHDLTFTTLTLGILVITILTVTISFTIPKPLCEHYIMGPLFLILQSLLIPYLQPHQLPVSKSILLIITFFQ